MTPAQRQSIAGPYRHPGSVWVAIAILAIVVIAVALIPPKPKSLYPELNSLVEQVNTIHATHRQDIDKATAQAKDAALAAAAAQETADRCIRRLDRLTDGVEAALPRIEGRDGIPVLIEESRRMR